MDRAARTVKTLLTGASGFIGRRLAARLQTVHPEANLRCLVKTQDDPFCESGACFLRSRSLRTIATDLVTGQGLRNLPDHDLIFHLAANTHTWERDHQCNDRGTEHLLQALGPLGPNNHIVFTSTTAVMDNREDLKTLLQPQPSVRRPPLSRYGLSKWRAEEFLRGEAREQGFRLSIVRLCTVYGPDPRPNTLFDVLKRKVASRSLVSRLNWPGLTSFIHVEDVATCLLKVADDPPEPGEARTYLLATESKTLADVAQLLYRARGLAYKMICLPMTAWRLMRNVHRFCRLSAGRLPTFLFNQIWRFNMVVNPVFHCDTTCMSQWFPNLQPRLMADCIHEI